MRGHAGAEREVSRQGEAAVPGPVLHPRHHAPAAPEAHILQAGRGAAGAQELLRGRECE